MEMGTGMGMGMGMGMSNRKKLWVPLKAAEDLRKSVNDYYCGITLNTRYVRFEGKKGKTGEWEGRLGSI